MHLYPRELKEIAEIVKQMDRFMSTFLDGKTAVEVEIPMDFDFRFPIVSKDTGTALGHVGYTDDGEIGFIPNGME